MVSTSRCSSSSSAASVVRAVDRGSLNTIALRTAPLNKATMSTELFRFRRRAVMLAAVMLIASPTASPAAPKATPASATAKTKPPAKLQPKPKRKAGKVAATAPPVVTPSDSAARIIGWVAAEHDNGKLPYIVIDKQNASMILFKADGTPVGQTPVLLGIGIGDDSSPGVGAKSLAEIGPAERTTPAGRFVAKFGKAFGNTRVLWVDYANSVALHAVITTHKSEHRVERLLSPTPDDNRISFGCINVGTSFYTRQVRPLFQKAGGVVYILPDTKSLDDVFPRVRLLPYLNETPTAPTAG
jgi:hypothetical protein